jgi:hypothetical protein
LSQEFPDQPKITKGAILVIKYNSKGIIIDSNTVPLIFQYNPETLTRTIFPLDHEEIFQKNGKKQYSSSMVELINLSVEFDAADQLEQPNQHEYIAKKGLHPTLAALESIMHSQNPDNITSPVILFIWGSNRIIPVWLDNLKITEEAFDSNLNPIRIRLEIDMRVRDLLQLKKGSLGSAIYKKHLENRKTLARVFNDNKENHEQLNHMFQNIHQYTAIEKSKLKKSEQKKGYRSI